MASEREVAGAIGGADDYVTKLTVAGEMFQGQRRIGRVEFSAETDPSCYIDAAAHRQVQLKGLAAMINGLADAGWEMSQGAAKLVATTKSK